VLKVGAEEVITADCNVEVDDEIEKKEQEGQEVADSVVLEGR
jgi:hypothetical protein